MLFCPRGVLIVVPVVVVVVPHSSAATLRRSVAASSPAGLLMALLAPPLSASSVSNFRYLLFLAIQVTKIRTTAYYTVYRVVDDDR
eukprot:5961627-Pyramimonas_sp.AAC.1